MHALPLCVLFVSSFVHPSVHLLSLFSLFVFSFLSHGFSFSFFCFLCVWPLSKTSIWKLLRFWSFYSFVSFSLNKKYMCLHVCLSLCLVFFVLTSFFFTFLFISVNVSAKKKPKNSVLIFHDEKFCLPFLSLPSSVFNLLFSFPPCVVLFSLFVPCFFWFVEFLEITFLDFLLSIFFLGLS